MDKKFAKKYLNKKGKEELQELKSDVRKVKFVWLQAIVNLILVVSFITLMIFVMARATEGAGFWLSFCYFIVIGTFHFLVPLSQFLTAKNEDLGLNPELNKNYKISKLGGLLWHFVIGAFHSIVYLSIV